MTREEILHYISSLDGWLSSHEGFFLYERAMERKTTVKSPILEIGSWLGKSTICLAAGLMNGNGGVVYAVDPHKGEYTKNNGIGTKAPTFKKFVSNLKKAGVSQIVTPLIATSEKAAKKWKSPIDFLFIDGLHDYKNTELDFSLWSPFLVKDGTIAFHDAFCGHIGPEKVVVENVLHNNNWSEIGVVGSIVYARKGRTTNIIKQIDLVRQKFFISLAININKTNFPTFLKFLLIHRIVKLLLINRYTLKLQFQKA